MYINYISINTPWISVILSFMDCYYGLISNIFYCGVLNALLSELCLIAFWAHSLFGAFSHVHLLPEVLSRAATCQKASGSRGPRKRGFVWRFQCVQGLMDLSSCLATVPTVSELSSDFWTLYATISFRHGQTGFLTPNRVI